MIENEFIAKNNLRLGANFNPDTKSVDFKLYSAGATDVVLCIFKKPEGENEVCTFNMLKNKDDVFEISVKLSDCEYIRDTFYYGFRLFGANWIKEDGFVPGSDIGFKSLVDMNHNRFNPNKIAYDPYGLEISHLPSKYEKYRVNKENYKEDNAPYAPKTAFNYLDDFKMPKIKTKRAFKNEIIGEVHLKDLTELLNINEHGTYLGAVKFAKKLREMGFTTIEFLPLNEFDDLDNYWGYMPLSYFALSKKYSYSKTPGASLQEFRELVKAFHENDIKVCLDVIYNHTGEARIYGDNQNDVNLMSYALIDNKTYYKQTPDNYYTSYSGCLNDLNIANKPVQDMIIDSLEFLACQGVDAFRFDLAAALMDTDNGVSVNYDKYNSFVCHIKERLKEKGIRVLNVDEEEDGIFLIAEPWMAFGSNSYQLGNFPDYWGEWNDVAKNTIRANTISSGTTDPLGLRNLIEGAPFCFGDKLKSINYIASHDGFTLNDLNSYDRKAESTKDGSDNEMCSSYGGDIKTQELSIKKQIVLLFLSKGIPMLQVGDMMGHTKFGNNNSYNLDSKINYLDYSKVNVDFSREQKIFNFTKSMIDFRNSHKVLTDTNYQYKIEYYATNGLMVPYDNRNFWQNRSVDYFLFKTTGDDVFYCAISKAIYPMEIKLPKNNVGKDWYFVLDTTRDDAVREKGNPFMGNDYILEPNSCVIFVEA